MSAPRIRLGVRGDVAADGDRCDGCGRSLAGADLRRVVVEGTVDLLALCVCGEPTVVAWVSEADR